MNQVSIAARLNRLPTVKSHRKIAAIVGIAQFFDLWDIFLAGVLASTLTKEFHLNSVMLPLVISSGFIGMFLGAIFLGRLTDRFGRKFGFLFILGFYSLFTLAGAFSANATMLIVFRFLAGLGIGAAPPVADTYMSEMFPPKTRGSIFAKAMTLGFFGIPASGFLARFLVPLHPFGVSGWRWLFVIGALGAAIVWFMQQSLLESPRWLESVGRIEEAEAITRKLEKEALEEYRQESLPQPKIEEIPIKDNKLAFQALFSPQYIKRTLMLWVFHIFQTVGFYGFGTIIPMVLVAKGYSVTNSLTYVALSFIGYPVGSALSIPVMEKMDRKWLIVISAFLLAVFGLSVGYSTSSIAIIVLGFLYTCTSNIFSNAFHLFQAEVFPTFIRSTAVGTAYSLSRVSSAVLPFVLLPVLHSSGPVVMFALMAAAMLFVMLDIGILGPSTTGKALEIVEKV